MLLKRIVLLATLAGLLAAAPANAGRSLDSQLQDAESQAAAADQKVAQASRSADRAQRQLARVSPKAERASIAAAEALAVVDALESEMTAQRIDALEEVRQLESDYSDDKDTHNDSVAEGVGFGLAALILAAIAFTWTRFRGTPLVEQLADQTGWRAIGMVGGGGLLLLLIGGALLGASGASRAIGAFLSTLALGGSASLLLARHSLRVERGEGQSLVSRERFPRWVMVAVAILLFLLGVGSLGDAMTSEAPEEPDISAETRELAEAAEGDPLEPATDELLAAREAAAPLVARADELGSARDEARDALIQARQSLRAGRRHLHRAQLRATRVSERIARQAARQQALASPPSTGGGSSPSYSSCDTAPSNIPVPPGSSLDGDGDGIGCEE